MVSSKRLTAYFLITGVLLIIGGAAFLGISFRERWTTKIDPNCEDYTWLKCPRKISDSATKQNFIFRLSGAVCLVLAMIALFMAYIVFHRCCRCLCFRDDAFNLSDAVGGIVEIIDLDDYNSSGGKSASKLNLIIFIYYRMC